MAGLSQLLQSGSLAYSNPSPASVAARRKLAEQLLEGSRIQNAGPFGALANTLGGSFSGYENRQAGEQEAAGMEGYNSLIAKALQNPEMSNADLAGLASNPWAGENNNPIAAALMGQAIQRRDPSYQMDMQLKQMELDAARNPPPPKPDYTTFNNSAGDVYRYDKNDPNAQPSLFYDNPDMPATADLPSGVQEYEYAKSQGYGGTYEQWKMDMAKAGATNIDFNQNQGTAAAFADRMAASDSVLNDPALLSAMTDLKQQVVSGVPLAGNFLVSKEFQLAEQAQRDFVNSILRRESGAVISPSEFENAKKQYFPQPGDSPEVIQQKAANRRIAIDGVVRAAGPNYAAPSMQASASPDQSVDDILKGYGL